MRAMSNYLSKISERLRCLFFHFLKSPTKILRQIVRKHSENIPWQIISKLSPLRSQVYCPAIIIPHPSLIAIIPHMVLQHMLASCTLAHVLCIEINLKKFSMKKVFHSSSGLAFAVATAATAGKSFPPVVKRLKFLGRLFNSLMEFNLTFEKRVTADKYASVAKYVY